MSIDANRSSETEGPAFILEKGANVWRLMCTGSWNGSGIQQVDDELRALAAQSFPALEMDTSNVQHFDTYGAWMVERLRAAASHKKIEFRHIDGDQRRKELVNVLRTEEQDDAQARASQLPYIQRRLAAIGRSVVKAGDDVLLACHLIGASLQGAQMKAGKHGGLRLAAIIHQLDHMGLRAVPVITVMSFLIGAIIAQQGAFQLKYFGEELLTVNLVGILHLREIAVLLTAIMVAGRTGSAITAQIGMMKIREEVDALQVIGLNPIGVLIYPRLVALIIAMPLLTFIADLGGVAGAIVVSYLYVGITPTLFMQTLQTAIDLSTLFSGLIKAPFMAIIIGLVAAIEGLKVGGSAESLGRHTTASVVRAIFCVIVVDGLFAIFYAAIGY